MEHAHQAINAALRERAYDVAAQPLAALMAQS
jgi:hypothetical protein